MHSIRVASMLASNAVARTVVVTGCSSGFGELIARTLAASGYRVFATMRDMQSRNAPAAQALRDWATQRAALLEVLELDVTSDTSVERAINDVARFGIDGAILEPGSFPTQAVAKATRAERQEVVQAYAVAAPPQAPTQPTSRGPHELPHPQEVADAIKQLIEMSAGERPLRTVVGPVFTEGVAEYNSSYQRVRDHLAEVLRRPDQAITWTRPNS